jgi:hypothetical protein
VKLQKSNGKTIAGISMATKRSKLKKKYGYEKGSGYRKAIQNIISKNSENIHKTITGRTERNFKKNFGSVSKEGREVKLPNVESLLPTASEFEARALEGSKRITKKLQQRVNKVIQNNIDLFTQPEGPQLFTPDGEINPGVVDAVKLDLDIAMEGYTKRKDGMSPAQVRSIAVTEFRSIGNELKENYVKELLENNRGIIKGFKIWQHHPELSITPRIGHGQTDRKKVKMEGKFKVPRYKVIKGKPVKIGVTFMDRPHDPTAPIDQKAGCNCDLKYQIVKTK